MISLMIKKRTLALVVLSVIGLGLLFAGWHMLKNGSSVPGNKVDLPVTYRDSLGAAGRLSREGDIGTASGGATDFFVEYRLERERTRGQRVEYLREVINNNNSANEIRQKAQEHLLAISRNMEKEVELENLIKAKGFQDAAAILDEKVVTVIVAAAGFSSEETVRLKDLISKGTGIEAQNIVIIPK